MRKAKIVIATKTTITSTSTNQVHQNIFDITFTEFQHQVSKWQGITTFEQVKQFLSQNVAGFQYQIAHPSRMYWSRLDFLPELQTIKQERIPVGNVEIELEASDSQNRNAHQINMYLYSEEMTLVDSYGNTLLLAWGDKSQELLSGVKIDTFELNNSNGDFEIRSYTPII